jgi:hypothetical protein
MNKRPRPNSSREKRWGDKTEYHGNRQHIPWILVILIPVILYLMMGGNKAPSIQQRCDDLTPLERSQQKKC